MIERPRITITRYRPDHRTCTMGRLTVMVPGKDTPVFKGWSLELPWRGNERRVSCIPPAPPDWDGHVMTSAEKIYTAYRHQAPSFGDTILISGVPGRDEILIHPGNLISHTLGCILPGISVQDLNGDKMGDVAMSRAAMALILDHIPDACDVRIRWANPRVRIAELDPVEPVDLDTIIDRIRM